jgi:hypothetical protein
MIWYVAFIAVLNLGLGYMLGVYMERSRRAAAYLADEAFDHEGL